MYSSIGDFWMNMRNSSVLGDWKCDDEQNVHEHTFVIRKMIQDQSWTQMFEI